MAETDFGEIERLNEKLRRDPKSRIFAQLADAYRRNGMVDEALEVLKTGLDVHPNYATAHLVLARCYIDKHLHEMAKDSLKKVVTLDPQSMVGYRLLAQICEKLGDENDLILAYKGITALDQTDVETKKKLEELLKKKAEEDVLASLSLAREYENQGYFEKALEIYKKLSYHDPGDIELQNKVKELSDKVMKVATKEPEVVKVEGLETTVTFEPTVTTEVEEDKLDKLPPLEELLPTEKKVEEFIPEAKPEKAVEPAAEVLIPEPEKEEIKPVVETKIQEPVIEKVEEIQEITKEISEVKPEGEKEAVEITPLETLLEKSEPTPSVAEQPVKLDKEEISEIDKFLATPEEKPEASKPEEPVSSLESLLKEEPKEKQPKSEVEPQKPPVEKPSERPKGDDFQSFQEWLSGLLK